MKDPMTLALSALRPSNMENRCADLSADTFSMPVVGIITSPQRTAFTALGLTARTAVVQAL
jgi:hypothetical protein